MKCGFSLESVFATVCFLEQVSLFSERVMFVVGKTGSNRENCILPHSWQFNFKLKFSLYFFCLSLYKLHSLPPEFSFYSSSLFFKLVLYCKKVSFQTKTYIALYKVPQLCDVSAVKNRGFDIDIVKHYV